MRALFITVVVLTLLAGISVISLPFYLLNRAGEAVPATTREVGDATVKVIDAFARLLKPEAWTRITLDESHGADGKLDLVLAEYTGLLQAERSERWLYVSDLVIEADVAYTFNFFVPLKPEAWHLEAKETNGGKVKLRVVVPALEITPAKISSQVKKITTKDNSTFISKERVTSDLLSVLMEEQLLPLARKKRVTPIVRETARVKAKQFLQQWVLRQYADSAVLAGLEGEDIQLVFADEPAAALLKEP
jgi:hypothetical protein